jgi:DNA-directed RNA polymerase subunit omega
MAESTEGIINPPIDELLKRVDSKFGLVIFASKRARQINNYYTDLHEGSLFNNVGPLVDAAVEEEPLSIALREIAEDKLVMTPIDPAEEAEKARAAAEAAADVQFGVDAAEVDAFGPVDGAVTEAEADAAAQDASDAAKPADDQGDTAASDAE